MNIKLSSFISAQCASIDDGQVFFKQIYPEIKEGRSVKVNFEGVDVLASDEMRQGIKNYTDWPTIPQLYVKGEFIGGCDIVKEMFEKGELKNLLKNKSLLS